MHRWRNILFNISFAVNCLLLFLLLFENRLVLPPWLQVTGRMHPLMLHFPIVLIVLSVFGILFIPGKIKSTEIYVEIAGSVLLLTAFTASITSLMGLFLSRESGYDASSLVWHKWGGVLVSLMALAWYSFRNTVRKTVVNQGLTIIIALGTIIFTGHQGAGITHGQNFLLAPILPEKAEPRVPLDEAIVYAHMVRPILQTKCMSCHNRKKAKGELIMETEALLKKGGKDGVIWDSTKPDLGLLLRRIHLPLEARKHMPPRGKPQLTEEESEILYRWIKSGADFQVKVTDLAETDTLRRIAGKIFTTIETEDYDFAAADEKKIQQLNGAERVVAPLALESPALTVSFFGRENFTSGAIRELLGIKNQLVSLNLDHMPVKDEDLPVISQFSNLRKLSLNFTAISGKKLGLLKELPYLRALSLSGIPINRQDIQSLSSFPQLRTVYAWNTALTEAEEAMLRKEKGNIKFETGFRTDTMLLKLTPPVLENEKQVILSQVALKLKHYIRGTDIRYTLDGTEPDSIHSPLFQHPVTLGGKVLVKAKAFKPGWISSDVLEVQFYKAGFPADSLLLLLPPDDQYKGDGGMTLFDLEKGDLNFRSGKWLGFRQNKMDVLLLYHEPVSVQSIILSGLVDIGSYLMPPESIEVWGGTDRDHLKLLSRITPVQPIKLAPAELKLFECRFKTVSLKVIRVVATPVPKLPAWHPGKGDKGWVFSDEIFVN